MKYIKKTKVKTTRIIEYQMLFNLHKKKCEFNLLMMQHLVLIVRLMKFSIFKNCLSGIN